MNSLRFLQNSMNVFNSSRLVSSKYIKPHPRPYKRRLYEAALAPYVDQLPAQPICSNYRPILKGEIDKYSDIELALVKHVREWLDQESFQVLAVCQYLSVNLRTVWLTRNRLRMKGISFRSHSNRIMKKIFECTPLQSLEPLIVANTCILFGKDFETLRAIRDETRKLNWIVPLAFVYGSRILLLNDVEELCKRPLFEDHRAETSIILSNILENTPIFVLHHINQLVLTLQQIQDHY